MNTFKLQYNVKAPKGRKVTARGNALGLKERTHSIAPRINIIQGGAVAWGKIATTRLAVPNRLTYITQQCQLTY